MLKSIKNGLILTIFLGLSGNSMLAMQVPGGFKPFSVNDIFNPTAVLKTSKMVQKNPTVEKNIFSTRNIVSAALFLGTTSVIWYKIYQYYTMWQINSWLKDSAPGHPTIFKFSSWLQLRYKFASDIIENAKTIADKFPEIKEITKTPEELILEELASIRADLKFLSNKTQLPHIITAKANSAFGMPATEDHSINNILLAHCQSQVGEKLSNLKRFEAFIDEAYEEMQATYDHSSFFDRFIYRPPNKTYKVTNVEQAKEKEKKKGDNDNDDEQEINIIFYQRSRNPFSWSFVCEQKKATELYRDVLKRYLRLLALQAINGEKPFAVG